MYKKNTVLLGIAAITFCISQASAGELWNPVLRGTGEGLVSGALPPSGVYGSWSQYYGPWKKYDNEGHRTGLKLDPIVEIPALLWVPGVQILGADYAVAIAQPFDYTNARMYNNPNLSDNAHWGTFNTILVPGQLSWSLPYDFHVKTGLTVYVDDASSSPGDPAHNNGVGSGNGYWSLQPDFAVSWLHDGWNLSLDGHWTYNFENDKTHYRSGNIIEVDYTIAKTFGKWTVGAGFYQENQLARDSGIGALAAGCPASGGCKAELYGGGPLVGYQFEDINIMAIYNHAFYERNDMSGDVFNIRFSKAF